MTGNVWTDEKTILLRTLWDNKGLSAAQIAAELGTSRNAVLGKAHRLNLTPREPGKSVRQFKPRVRSPAKEPEIAPEFVSLNPVRLLGLSDTNCHWPLSDALKHFFCGDPTKPRGPYCSHHLRIAHQPTKTTPNNIVTRGLSLRLKSILSPANQSRINAYGSEKTRAVRPITLPQVGKSAPPLAPEDFAA